MQAHDGVRLLTGRKERVPHATEDRRQPHPGRELREAHGLVATIRIRTDLTRRDLDVGQPGQLQRDDPLGMGRSPHLHVPVVERPQAGQSKRRVLRPRVHGPAEPRHERGEAEGGPDAAPVHVDHSRLNVVTPRPHLLEARRVHAPLVLRSAHHGVEPDVGVEVSSKTHAWAPFSNSTTLGAPPCRPEGKRPSNMSAGSIRWSSTEMIGTLIGRGSGSGSSVALPSTYSVSTAPTRT